MILASQLSKGRKYVLGAFHMPDIVFYTFIYVIQINIHNPEVIFQDAKCDLIEINLPKFI